MFKPLFDRDKIYPYPWYFAEECLTKDIEKIFNKKINKTILEFKKGHLQSYVEIEQFNEIGKFLFEKVKTDKEFYKVVEKNILETGEHLMNFCRKIEKLNTDELSNKQLLDIYNEYAIKLKIMRAWGWVPPLIDGVEIYFLSDYTQEKLREFLKNINQEEKTGEYFSVLSSSEEMSEVQTEEIERLKLLQKIESINKDLIESLKNSNTNEFVSKIKDDYPDIFNIIRDHAKKFGWLTYAYEGPMMNESNVINLIKGSLKQKETTSEQIDKIKEHYKEVTEEKKIIIKKIKLPDELKYLFEVSAFFMHLKDLRKGIYQKSYVAMDPVIEEISKRIGLTFEEAKYINSNEIKQALIEKKDFSKIAKQRTEYSIAIIKNGIAKLYQGEEARRLIKEYLPKTKINEDIRELKGSIAYSGKARGIVRIILVVKDIPKLKEGDILVSSSTNPDLVPAMKLASAFITDMGGITCHAAIVAREMKKPCIIGTKIATKVLHDGDLVEVDAEKGIIKIIKRA